MSDHNPTFSDFKIYDGFETLMNWNQKNVSFQLATYVLVQDYLHIEI